MIYDLARGGGGCGAHLSRLPLDLPLHVSALARDHKGSLSAFREVKLHKENSEGWLPWGLGY